MAEMHVLPESQGFGRWGQPVPAQEFSRGFPELMPQAFGKTWPQAVPQQFGGRIPLVDQGWRSPWREIPPSGSKQLLH